MDVTETAEGSLFRQDLQTSLSLNSVTAFSVSNTTTTIINLINTFQILLPLASIFQHGIHFPQTLVPFESPVF